MNKSIVYEANTNVLVLNSSYPKDKLYADSTMIISNCRNCERWKVKDILKASGRYTPIHPQAPKMTFIEQNKREFVKGQEHLYRRLSLRECARIQTFPDEPNHLS